MAMRGESSMLGERQGQSRNSEVLPMRRSGGLMLTLSAILGVFVATLMLAPSTVYTPAEGQIRKEASKAWTRDKKSRITPSHPAHPMTCSKHGFSVAAEYGVIQRRKDLRCSISAYG